MVGVKAVRCPSECTCLQQLRRGKTHTPPLPLVPWARPVGHPHSQDLPLLSSSSLSRLANHSQPKRCSIPLPSSQSRLRSNARYHPRFTPTNSAAVVLLSMMENAPQTLRSRTSPEASLQSCCAQSPQNLGWHPCLRPKDHFQNGAQKLFRGIPFASITIETTSPCKHPTRNACGLKGEPMAPSAPRGLIAKAGNP